MDSSNVAHMPMLWRGHESAQLRVRVHLRPHPCLPSRTV